MSEEIKAFVEVFIIILWIAFMGFLVEINVHPILGGLVLMGGVIFIARSFGAFNAN